MGVLLQNKKITKKGGKKDRKEDHKGSGAMSANAWLNEIQINSHSADRTVIVYGKRVVLDHL